MQIKKLLRNYILVEMEKEPEEEVTKAGIIMTTPEAKPYKMASVIMIGPEVKGIEIGDVLMLNRYLDNITFRGHNIIKTDDVLALMN